MATGPRFTSRLREAKSVAEGEAGGGLRAELGGDPPGSHSTVTTEGCRAIAEGNCLAAS